MITEKSTFMPWGGSVAIVLHLLGYGRGEAWWCDGVGRVEFDSPSPSAAISTQDGSRRLIALAQQGFNRALDLLSGPFYELFGMGTCRYELESFFGVKPQESRKVAWASAGTCCKNWNQQRVVRRFGLEAVAELVDWEREPHDLRDWQGQKQPLILVSWHSGVPYSVAAGLWREGLETLFCVGPPPPFAVPDGLIYVPTRGGGLDRTEALHRALRYLRDGGAVFVVADHPTFSKTRVPMWGREVSFAPSIGMLARVSGALVVPIVSRWNDRGRIEIKHGVPLSVDNGGVDDLYRDLGEWFEAHFQRHPEELEPKYVMKLLFSPPVGA